MYFLFLIGVKPLCLRPEQLFNHVMLIAVHHGHFLLVKDGQVRLVRLQHLVHESELGDGNPGLPSKYLLISLSISCNALQYSWSAILFILMILFMSLSLAAWYW